MARYVEDGVLDAGLTGYDWIVENGADVRGGGGVGLLESQPPAGPVGAVRAGELAHPDRCKTSKASGSPPRPSA